mmetsp:Transcript_19486/g.52462  ORF Transcript_19486/g.52462 Transcript_19486/m.52462 type:complete len:246 (+) Transcript_19486:122-859(+)
MVRAVCFHMCSIRGLDPNTSSDSALIRCIRVSGCVPIAVGGVVGCVPKEDGRVHVLRILGPHLEPNAYCEACGHPKVELRHEIEGMHEDEGCDHELKDDHKRDEIPHASLHVGAEMALEGLLTEAAAAELVALRLRRPVGKVARTFAPCRHVLHGFCGRRLGHEHEGRRKDEERERDAPAHYGKDSMRSKSGDTEHNKRAHAAPVHDRHAAAHGVGAHEAFVPPIPGRRHLPRPGTLLHIRLGRV